MVSRLRNWLGGERSIIRGAFLLGSGAAIGQVILIVATPVISRLYTPVQIGYLALYLSFINVAVTIAPLGYPAALPSTDSRREASFLASGIILIQPVIIIILSACLWLLVSHGYMGFGKLPGVAVLLTGFTVFANTLMVTLQFWFVREERYEVMSRVQVMQNAGRTGLQIGLGLAGLGLFGLIVGDFCGRLLGLSDMFRRAWPDLRATVQPFDRRPFRAAFWKFRRFLFPQLPSIAINITARMLPVPLLVHYYGVGAAGMYAMADRIMQVPVSFVGNSVGNALHGRIGFHSRTEPQLILGVFLKASGALLLAGILPTMAVVLWGPAIFRTVLGEQWSEAGRIAALLAPLSLAMLVVSTTSRIVYIFQAFATAFWYNLASAMSIVGVFWAAQEYRWAIEVTISWLAKVGVVAYILYFVLQLDILRRGLGRLSMAAVGKSGSSVEASEARRLG